jgi:hypothetical protein
MKTIKFILLIFVLSCSTMLMATEYKLHQTSSATFKSVSTGGVEHLHSNPSWNNRTNNNPSWYNRTNNNHHGAMRTTNPISEFTSTSAMNASGSGLPSAAVNGVIIANDLISSTKPRGPRRVIDEDDDDDKPENWDDPNKTPLGDIPWLWMALLALGYAIYLRRKNSLASHSSRH